MEICRACLATEVEMVPMDDKFLNKFNMFTNLNITMEDKSLYTCSACFNAFTFCIMFREKCIASDQTLKGLIPDIKVPKEEIDDEIPIIVKAEFKQEYVDDAANAEFIDECYNYGEDYVEPTTEPEPKKPQKVRKSTRKYKKSEVVIFDTNFNCGLCPTILKSKDELTDHLDHHKTDFTCALCKESVISVPHLLGHRMKHLPKNQKRCHICSKKFITSENLEFHYMRVHSMAEKDAQILCKDCLKPFASVGKLQKHFVNHAERKYTCDYCSNRFRSRKLLQTHIVGRHTAIPSFKCNLCDFTCNYASGVTSHKVRMHSVDKVACKTCGRYFPNQEKLDKHVCKHRLPVICPVCGITFQAKGRRTFNAHIKTHNRETYKCLQCPATFKSKECFRAHMDKHAGTPRFRCTTCDRRFYNQPCLNKHQRTHTGEKPYVCKICNRGFTGNHNLKMHMKVHGIHNLIKKKDSLEKDND